MKIVGLTGSFGTGKTSVASVFKSLGAKVIDADKIARSLIEKNGPERGRIVAAFGPEILAASGRINRSKLAGAVFGNKNALARLNRIVHPGVIRRIKAIVKTSGRDAVVVIDAPLLIEAGLLNIVDKLVVVSSSKKRQIERCRKKFRIKREEVLRRISNQMSLKKKLKLADFVVKNDGTKSAMRSQVKKVWEEIVWR